MVRLNGETGRRPARGSGDAILPVVGALVCLGVGVLLMVAVDDASAKAAGGVLVALGVLGGATQAVLRSRGGSRAQVHRHPQGSVTRVPGSPAMLALPLTALALVAGVGGVAAGALVVDQQVVLGALVGLLAAASLAAIVPPLLRGDRADHVDLAPRGVTWQHHGERWTIDWDDVLGAAAPPGPGGVVPLVLDAGRQPQRLAGTWPLWRRTRAPEGMEDRFAVVPTRNLRVDADLLARVLTRLAREPEVRGLLGTESADDLTSLAGEASPLY